MSKLPQQLETCINKVIVGLYQIANTLEDYTPNHSQFMVVIGRFLQSLANKLVFW